MCIFVSFTRKRNRKFIKLYSFFQKKVVLLVKTKIFGKMRLMSSG